MTITEATQLILEASAMGEDGRIYVLDMGKPVLISELADELIRLSGKEPGKDINVVYTGLRPGEKLHEELFHNDEDISSTEYAKIHLAATRKVESSLVEEVFSDIVKSLDGDEEGLRKCIQMLVPEYQINQISQDKKTA